MNFKTVNEAINVSFNLGDEGKYKEALEIMNTGLNNFAEEDLNEHKFDIFVAKIWFNSLLKNAEGFINNIIEAVEKGFICPKWMFEFKHDKEYKDTMKLKEMLSLHPVRCCISSLSGTKHLSNFVIIPLQKVRQCTRYHRCMVLNSINYTRKIS